MTLEQQYYLVMGIFCGVKNIRHLDYDLCSTQLVDFSYKYIKQLDKTNTQSFINDDRLLEKLRQAATNNPDKLDLNWFHYFFNHQITYDNV